jgi:hypothetical protein
MGDLSFLDYIIYTLMPFGQIFARIINYNGSLDLWWLLLIPFFHLPLIGLFPLLIMKMLNMKDGIVSTPVIDKFAFLPILFKFYSPYVLPYIGLENNTVEYLFTTFSIQIIIGMIANISRRNSMCKESLTVNAVGKAFMDATVSHNFGELMIYLVTIIPFINDSYYKSYPYVGNFINSIIWSLGYLLTYAINNMYNEYDKNRYCSLKLFGNGQDMFLFLGSIFTLIMVKYNSTISNYIPQNKTFQSNFQSNILSNSARGSFSNVWK